MKEGPAEVMENFGKMLFQGTQGLINFTLLRINLGHLQRLLFYFLQAYLIR